MESKSQMSTVFVHTHTDVSKGEAEHEEQDNRQMESVKQEVELMESRQQKAELVTEGEELRWQERDDVASGRGPKRVTRKPVRYLE